MPKTNEFNVKKIKDNKITIKEQTKTRSPLIIFFRNNGKLIFVISLLLSLTAFIIAASLTITNMKESSEVEYESNGVVVSFDSPNNSIINGLPITEEYADKIFSNSTTEIEDSKGVVIKIKEISIKDYKIIFYSDKTSLIKYPDGEYLRISSVDNNYGVTEEGVINKNAVTKRLTGEIKENRSLDIKILYLSDGSIEITKNNTVLFVRNNDITNKNDVFYTNLSTVSIPIKIEGNKIYYSNNTIKENDYIIVENKKYNKKEEKIIAEGIKIIYYENNFAEVIKDELSLIVEKSDHIKYDDNIFEIVDKKENKTNIKDVMDIKNITLKNENPTSANYIVVLEETSNYQKYNVNKILSNEYINYNIDVNGNKIKNNILNNKLVEDKDIEGLSLQNKNYLLYEGKIDKYSELSIKLGFWISYEKITNEYMNSAFIGTVKIYVESIS